MIVLANDYAAADAAHKHAIGIYNGAVEALSSHRRNDREVSAELDALKSELAELGREMLTDETASVRFEEGTSRQTRLNAQQTALRDYVIPAAERDVETAIEALQQAEEQLERLRQRLASEGLLGIDAQLITHFAAIDELLSRREELRNQHRLNVATFGQGWVRQGVPIKVRVFFQGFTPDHPFDKDFLNSQRARFDLPCTAAETDGGQ